MMRVALFLLCAAFTPVATAAEEGLVVHYPFDEGAGSVAHDAGGHGLDGTLHGARFVPLQEGFALEFDGEDDYVEIPDSDLLRFTGAVTVSAWVNTPVSSEQTVVAKNGCSVLRQNYRISLDQGSTHFTVVECPEHGKTAAGGGIEPDRWHHVAGTHESGRSRIYVDGILQAEHAFGPFTVGTLEAHLYIGASYYGAGLGGHFTGQIDDVRIYGRALTDAELLSQYEAGKDLRITTRDRLLAQVSPTRESDTTPPALTGATPPPDSQVDGPPIISARFNDAGSGIDVASARIRLDGDDVTDQAEITQEGFTLTPFTDLADGVHLVDVDVSDQVGNPGNVLRWRFALRAPIQVVSQFDGDVFRVHGEPYFPVGIYASNVSPGSPMPYLIQAAEAGINFKLIGERAVDVLDDLHLLGMKGLVHVYYASLALGNGDPQQLTEVVEGARGHPANLGWWNEYQSVNQSPLAVDTYEFIGRLDPSHPVIYMLAWAGKLSDAYFVYAYPILNPLLPDDSIMSIDELILQPAFEAAREEGKGKQVWFASQTFDYRLDMNRGEIVTLEGGFRPSREEIRSMNYLALTKGVKGLLFYAAGGEIPGTDYTADVAIYPRQWTEVLKLASELRYLSPVLAAGTPAQTAQLVQEQEAIHFTELSYGGVHTLISVNVVPEMVLAEWQFERPAHLKVLFEDRVAPSPVRSFTDLFEPLEVHVYQWPEAGGG